MSFLQVRLARDSLETPWGFRMQGGKDLNQPLTVQRVFTNTPSEGELQRGDFIVSINGRDTNAFTHKQAQDQIKYGGGQIDLFIKRPPPGQIHIPPLSPVKDTRAPTFPFSPTKTPLIQIPVRRRHSGPAERIIPITPSQSSPHHAPPKPGSVPMAHTAGFKPTKITLNKYGGGGYDFGTYSPKTPPAHAVPRPQAYHPPSPPRQQQQQQQQYHPPQQYQQPQQQYHQPSPPQPMQPSPPQQAVYMSQTTKEERGVEEEEYGGVHERRRKFVAQQAPPPQIHHTRRGMPAYGRAIADDSPVFGSDYNDPASYQTLPKAKKPSRPRPPPVNRRDDEEGWSSTLRAERNLKPWEKEALEMEMYQGATATEPFRPSLAPAVAPKPRITQITAQSTARPQQSAPRPSQHVSGASSPPKQPVPIGDRDWNDSYVYQMVHQESKRSHTSDMPGHPGQTQTVTQTRVMDEERRPGEEPHRTVKETVTRSGPQQLAISDQYGISDF